MSASVEQQLISCSVDDLLRMIGAGKATPGAGSAAALTGLIACNLCFTVIELTKDKPKYRGYWRQVEDEKARLEIVEATLRRAFEKDSEVFAEVIEACLKKAGEIKGSERYRQLLDEERGLREKATHILLGISKDCLKILESALLLFDVGYQEVRGDSSVAAWNALAAAKSGLYTCYLNLKKFRGEETAGPVREECDRLLEQLNSLQAELESRGPVLREEGLRFAAVEPAPNGGAHEVAGAGPAFGRIVTPPTPTQESPREALPLAARTSPKVSDEEPPARPPKPAAGKAGAAQSDEEVFARLFDKYARGKNRHAWFMKIRALFAGQGLGSFGEQEGFLGFVKKSLDENRYRSPERLTAEDLVSWYKTFKARERREGP